MRRMLLASVLIGFVAVSIGVLAEPNMSAAADQRKAGSAAEDGGSMKKVGTFFKDTWLTSKVKSKLFADKRAKGWAIHVETRGGVVALRGKVATAGERRAAEEIARSTKGVKGVVNRLQVVPETKQESRR